MLTKSQYPSYDAGYSSGRIKKYIDNSEKPGKTVIHLHKYFRYVQQNNKYK